MIPDDDFVAAVGAERPEAIAVEDGPAGDRLTYEQLDRIADTVAAALVDRGVTPGDRVALVLDPGVGFVVAFHATLRIGAVAVPLDPDAGRERMDAQLQQSTPTLLVTDSRPNLSPDAGEVARYDVLTGPAVDPDPSVRSARSPDDVVCLMSTSGTTGRPQLVSLTRRNLVSSALASAMRLGVDPADRWLTPLAPHHMGGLAPIVRSAVYGTAYVSQPFETETVADTLATQDVTGLSLVPVMLRRLLDVDAPLARLRFVLVGGDRTPHELVERALSREVPLYVTYGMTETASQVATATPAELRADPETVGRPLRWMDVAIDDDLEGTDSADGRPRGELVVRGPMVAAGYWNDSAATADRFRSDGFHTGDEGRRGDDGRLFVHGRLDDRIVSGGVTIDPARVRAVLEALPGIGAAAVVGLPDEEWGERVCAMVVPVDPTADDLDTDRLRRELGSAAYPKQIVTTDALPRTVSGTVDRAAVRERLLEQGE